MASLETDLRMVGFLWFSTETEYIHFWNRKLPSGKHTENYGKSPFFMGIFKINGDFP